MTRARVIVPPRKVTGAEVVQAVLEDLYVELAQYFESLAALEEYFPNGVRVEPYSLRSKLEAYAARTIEQMAEQGHSTSEVSVMMRRDLQDKADYIGFRAEILRRVAAKELAPQYRIKIGRKGRSAQFSD